MYAKFFTLATLAAVVVAAPQGGITNSCNVVDQHCCDTVQTVGSQTVQSLISKGLVGANAGLGDLSALVGVTCTPISALAVSGQSCNAQPVCCSNNTFNGVIVAGCNPVNVNL